MRINPPDALKVPMIETLAVNLDHLVFACADLSEGIDRMTRRLGMEPVVGGRHPAWGTRNALLGLDREGYVEVVGPDLSLPEPPEGRGLGVEGAGSGRLATWAVRVASIADVVARSAERGIDLGAVMPGARATLDGHVLEWVLSDPAADRIGGLVPFVIDWGVSRHPSVSLAAAGRVVGSVVTLRLRHPEPEQVRRALELMAVPEHPGSTPVEIAAGASSLEAILSTPRGEVVLR